MQKYASLKHSVTRFSALFGVQNTQPGPLIKKLQLNHEMSLFRRDIWLKNFFFAPAYAFAFLLLYKSVRGRLHLSRLSVVVINYVETHRFVCEHLRVIEKFFKNTVSQFVIEFLNEKRGQTSRVLKNNVTRCFNPDFVHDSKQSAWPLIYMFRWFYIWPRFHIEIFACA